MDQDFHQLHNLSQVHFQQLLQNVSDRVPNFVDNKVVQQMFFINLNRNLVDDLKNSRVEKSKFLLENLDKSLILHKNLINEYFSIGPKFLPLACPGFKIEGETWTVMSKWISSPPIELFPIQLH